MCQSPHFSRDTVIDRHDDCHHRRNRDRPDRRVSDHPMPGNMPVQRHQLMNWQEPFPTRSARGHDGMRAVTASPLRPAASREIRAETKTAATLTKVNHAGSTRARCGVRLCKKQKLRTPLRIAVAEWRDPPPAAVRSATPNPPPNRMQTVGVARRSPRRIAASGIPVALTGAVSRLCSACSPHVEHSMRVVADARRGCHESNYARHVSCA